MRITTVLYTILILFVAFTLGSGNARSGTITLRTKMTLSVVEDRIKVQLDATNTGNEPAKKVKAKLTIFDRSLTSDTVEQIGVQESKSFFFEIAIPGGKQGRFAFVGEVFFHDSGLNSFSALSGGTFLLASKYLPAATSRVSPVTLTQKGTLQIFLKSSLKHDEPFKITLFLPHALTTPQRVREMEIPPGRETPVAFDIVNRVGFGGAKYPIFCVVEYRQKSQQDALLVRSLVKIKAPENWFTKTRWYWLWGLGGICVAWTVFFVLLIIKRKGSDTI